MQTNRLILPQHAERPASHEFKKATSGLVIPRNDLAIRKSYLVSIPLTNVAQGTEIKFQRNDVLNPQGTGSVIFTGLETFLDSELSYDSDGNPVVTGPDGVQLALTLVWEDVEFIKDYPYLAFNTLASYGMIRRLNHVKIDLTKSYVKVLSTTATKGNAAVFNFFYQDPPSK